MSPLVLALVTPIFGFSLTLGPAPSLPPAMAAPALFPASALLLASSMPSALGAAEVNGGEAAPESFGDLMGRRRGLAKVHRALGVATWISMALTVGLGAIQYHNLYGFFADQGDNPCVRGMATFGQGQCSGTPWLHLGSALLSTALYSTTLGFVLGMPDPGGLTEGEGAHARELRRHRLLRWVHLGGMASQMLFGLLVAHPSWLGLDRANDYRTLQGLATAHQLTGWVTFGALSWAGAIMLF
ncbi:MAG: hypothetical protein OEY14_13755 [Myxococcales bacterium]|nr:hypothetical protein [Myxococcales bacterium]